LKEKAMKNGCDKCEKQKRCNSFDRTRGSICKDYKKKGKKKTMRYIPDYLDHWTEHNRQREEELNRLPVCECCGEHIQTRKAFYYNDQWFCTDRECEKELMELVWEDIKNDYLVEVER
jgi:hypothetical protein